MTAPRGPAPGRAAGFAVRVEGDRWLPPGGGDVHAVVRVTRIPPDPVAGPAPWADVALRLWTPRGTRVAALVQIVPEVCDLTRRCLPCGPRTGGYPVGTWAQEHRAYHLHLRVPPARPGRRMRAARIRVLAAGVDPRTAACGDVLAEWVGVDDPAAGAAGRDEPSRAAQEGLRAHPDGGTDTATVRLGRAAAPAHTGSGEAAAAPLDTGTGAGAGDADGASGTVRLRPASRGAGTAVPQTCTTTTVRTRAGDRESGAV